ncbi:MAG: GNAT family N-acetyltransferase [Candidatus Moranbacteria bacterium]|jgi:phosphinothricin acetyltransferase|nr:GNAT family N-acetyltransferase [Candidatus Moranbacteria bacterium]MDX9855231.1 GNAT family N-acetyltransferase [Candidatus Moranbacteria bacterium]
MITIRDLEIEDKKYLENLFAQLTQKPVKLDPVFLKESDFSHCRVIDDDGKIIGFAALIIHPVPTKGLVGRVEDVVIDEKYRGRGLGRKIMEDLIDIARREKIEILNLTSNPRRVPARKLYESLGFQLSDTGVFWMKLK